MAKHTLLDDQQILDQLQSGVPSDLLCQTYDINQSYINRLVARFGDRNPKEQQIFQQRSLFDGQRAFRKGTDLILKCYKKIEDDINSPNVHLSPTETAKIITAISNAQKVISTNNYQLGGNDANSDTQLNIHNSSKLSQDAQKKLASQTVINDVT